MSKHVGRFAMKISGRQCLVLGVYGFVQILGGMVYSIQAPFYPDEVSKIYST